MQQVTVGDLMSRDLITVSRRDSLATLRDKMYENHIRHLPVVDDLGRVQGLVSHRDLLRTTLMERRGISSYVEDSILEDMAVEQVMVMGLELASPETPLSDAASRMLEHKLGCLPVVDNNRLVGILTEADFVRLATVESATAKQALAAQASADQASAVE